MRLFIAQTHLKSCWLDRVYFLLNSWMLPKLERRSTFRCFCTCPSNAVTSLWRLRIKAGFELKAVEPGVEFLIPGSAVTFELEQYCVRPLLNATDKNLKSFSISNKTSLLASLSLTSSFSFSCDEHWVKERHFLGFTIPAFSLVDSMAGKLFLRNISLDFSGPVGPFFKSLPIFLILWSCSCRR